MSLSRTALRLAIIEALAPKAALDGTITFPTIAGRNVFDSDIGPEPITEPDKRSPRIVVYTDDGKREVRDGETGLNTQYDGTTEVSLAIETFVPGTVLDENGNALADPQLIVETDAVAEALLDMLAAQIVAAIDRARMHTPLCHVLVAITRIETRGWRDADSNLRLSSHRHEFDMMVQNQGPMPEGKTGLDRLPEPLRSVALALPTGSYGASICANIAAALVDPQPFDDLETIRIAAKVDGLAAPVVDAQVTDLHD